MGPLLELTGTKRDPVTRAVTRKAVRFRRGAIERFGMEWSYLVEEGFTSFETRVVTPIR